MDTEPFKKHSFFRFHFNFAIEKISCSNSRVVDLPHSKWLSPGCSGSIVVVVPCCIKYSNWFFNGKFRSSSGWTNPYGGFTYWWMQAILYRVALIIRYALADSIAWKRLTTIWISDCLCLERCFGRTVTRRPTLTPLWSHLRLCSLQLALPPMQSKLSHWLANWIAAGTRSEESTVAISTHLFEF